MKSVSHPVVALPACHREGQRFDLLIGTRTALRNAGIGRGQRFPDGVGCKARRAMLTDQRGVRVQVRLLAGEGRRYAARVPVSPFELAMRQRDRAKGRAREAVELDRGRRASAAKELGMSERDYALRGLPDSEETYRQRAMQSLEAYLEQIRKWSLSQRGGYAFDRPTLARFEIVAGVVGELMERARIILDEAAREAEITDRLERAGLARRREALPAATVLPMRRRRTDRTVPDLGDADGTTGRRLETV